ncbi:MAG: hypothetical protein JXR94_25040 [Candidatus Hydrogenedentes bacterium]|nr:hypothetical protein [Candidatus Hydrogenedentota bacterium]
MGEEFGEGARAWEYTLSEDESDRWKQADADERQEFLEELMPLLVKRTAEFDCDEFVICDRDGSVVVVVTVSRLTEPLRRFDGRGDLDPSRRN